MLIQVQSEVNIKITKKLQIDDNCEMQLKTLANKMQVFYNMDRLAIQKNFYFQNNNKILKIGKTKQKYYIYKIYKYIM